MESFFSLFLSHTSHPVHQQILPIRLWKYVWIQTNSQHRHHFSTSHPIYLDYYNNLPCLTVVIFPVQLPKRAFSKKVRSCQSTSNALSSFHLTESKARCPKVPTWSGPGLCPVSFCALPGHVSTAGSLVP